MEQPYEQPIESVQSSKNIWMIVIAVIITALIVGGGVYTWQRSSLKNTEQSLEQKISVLQNQISQLQQMQTEQNQQANKPIVEQQDDQPDEPASIPTQASYEFTFTNKNNFPIVQKGLSVLQHFNASDLENKSQECGTDKNQAYFNNLLSRFSANDKGHTYEINYTGQTQDSGTWKVTVIPNKLGYKNLDEFRKDFDLCFAGGDEYPKLVSENYLLFVSSCGTGFDDGSGLPHGCDVVRESIEPTIILK